MIDFIKRKKITILTIIFLISIIFIVVSTQKDLPITVESTIKPISTFQTLTLGKTNRNDTVKEIGIPQKEYVEGDKLYLEYLTSNPNYNDQFVFNNDKLNLIKKIVTIKDEIRVIDMENKYGASKNIMYGPGSSIGLYLYIYPEKGVAYLGHKVSGYLNEIWYFEPTDINNFKSQFASNYSDTLNETQ